MSETTNSNIKVFGLSMVLIIVLAIGGCDKIDGKEVVYEELALSAETTVGTEIDDSVITTKVKSALLTTENVNSTDVGVVTRDGIVRLSGFVNSQIQIERVLEVAGGIEGVQGTFNEMIIKK